MANIISIKRAKKGSSIKLYGKVRSETDPMTVYSFAYIRREGFRGWVCSCESFLLNKFGKHRNCKHIRQVREEFGRFGVLVPKAN